MDDTILSLGDLRLSAHLATPPPPGRGAGPRGVPRLPERPTRRGDGRHDLRRPCRPPRPRLRVRRAHVQLPRHGHVGGRLLGARLAATICAPRCARWPSAPTCAGVWTVGFGHGATFALCEAMNDDLVRGVAAIAARTSLGDWVRDPGGLVTEAREMGMIRTDGYPPDTARGVGSCSCSTPRTRSAVSATVRCSSCTASTTSTCPSTKRVRSPRPPGPNTEVRLVSGAGHHLRHDPRALATLLGWLDRQA